MSEKLTVDELCALFGRTTEDARWIGSADSEEFLAVVTYRVERTNGQ
jgi:hypothetical protein